MLDNRIFQITLLISALAHGVILVQNTNFLYPAKNKSEEKVEINYVKKPPENKPQPKSNFDRKIKAEPFRKMPEKITVEKMTPPPFVEKNSSPAAVRQASALKADTDKPALIQAETLFIKKKVILPALMDPEKINNPSYMSYYQLVREKIRRCAFRNYNGREKGEIYLSFIISSDGSLQQIALLQENSSKSDYLTGIAVNSVKAASPFPAFPKELNYSYLPFKLSIVFEVE